MTTSGPRLLEVAALTLLGIVLGRLVWALLSPDQSARPVTPAPAIQASAFDAGGLTGVDKTLLSSLNPFQESDIEVSAPIADDVPETALNLTLKGIRAVTGNGRAAATIVTPDNRQGLYAEGDEVLDGVVLSRILSDRIILDKNGRFESLFREGRDGQLNVINGETLATQQVAPREVVEPSVFRIASFQSLLRAGRIERASSPAGWRFRALGDRSGLEAAGIYDGDYIVSVEGIAAADLDYDRLSEVILSRDRINMAVRRGTQTVELTIVFEERTP